MTSFRQRFAAVILGALHGFDRLRLRGTKRWLANPRGLLGFLLHRGILLKDFGDYADALSRQLRTATEALVRDQGRPLQYLTRTTVSKEELIRGIRQRDGVRDGLVAVLSCVEPCWSFEVFRNKDTKHLELRRAWRKCLHYYHYFLDPEWDLVQVRVQTWLPFDLHVVLNGRVRLARQRDAAGIRYTRRDNCFTAVADLPQAQALADAQLRTDWAALLNGWVSRVHPTYATLFPDSGWPYYWSVDQSAWATDVLFRSADDLAALYPQLVRHGIAQLGSRDVLRFLGRKATTADYGGCAGEVVSDLKERPEGVRRKHRVNSNAVKMYDKHGSVLRIETTLNNVSDLKVYRPTEGEEEGTKDWRPLRKGIADLHRRTQVSQKANERYLEALATVATPTPLQELTEPLCRPVRWQQQRVRALNPLGAADAALLAAVADGAFVVNGLRNRDLRLKLYGAAPADQRAQRRQAAAVTRKLRLLRAHGVIRKIAKTQRYQVTEAGRHASTALRAARQADTATLTGAA